MTALIRHRKSNTNCEDAIRASSMVRTVLLTAAAAGCLLSAHLAVAENLGTVSEPLVGNSVVSAANQEKYTLVTLTIQKGSGGFASCSGSLLRNDWVVTAAHCVEVTPGGAPNEAGNSVTVDANWTTVQSGTSDQVYTFRPNDVALVHLSKPFIVNGMGDGFNRLIFQGNQFPYFGVTDGVGFVQFGRGINQYAHMEGNTPVMSSSDGQYRVGYFQFQYNTDQETEAWFSPSATDNVAGGDSGGPAFASVLSGNAIVGVLSQSYVTCLDGQDCSNSGWSWISGVTASADAPLGPVLPALQAVMGPYVPHQDPPQNSYVGTFGPLQNLAPMWVYAVNAKGNLLWYRKDSASAPWQGANTVGYGWDSFRDIIPAGGNAMYGLTSDGHLQWYRHDGFNDGSFAWTGPVVEGNGWSFQKVFSGGAGILYAIKSDGTLMWYDNQGYLTGQALFQNARVIGSGWNQFRDIFCSGQGTIYAITTDGKLLQYQHNGYLTGDFAWSGPLVVGTGFDQYSKVIAAGNGILLAFKPDGTLYSYKFIGDDHNPVPLYAVPTGGPFGTFLQQPSYWEGPTLIGNGWQNMETVFAMLPSPVQVPR